MTEYIRCIVRETISVELLDKIEKVVDESMSSPNDD